MIVPIISILLAAVGMVAVLEAIEKLGQMERQHESDQRVIESQQRQIEWLVQHRQILATGGTWQSWPPTVTTGNPPTDYTVTWGGGA